MKYTLYEVMECLSVLVGEREYFCPTTSRTSKLTCLYKNQFLDCQEDRPDQSSWCVSCYAKNAIDFMDDENYQKACQIIDEYYKQKEDIDDKK